MAEFSVGMRALIRRSHHFSAPIEVEVLEISPSGAHVKFTEVGWQAASSWELVEKLDFKGSLQKKWEEG